MTMRLRRAPGPCRVAAVRNNRHISCIGEYTGQPGTLFQIGLPLLVLWFVLTGRRDQAPPPER